MKAYKTTIKDVEWVFKVLSKEDYEKLHGSDSSGITMADKTEVHFLEGSFNKQVTGHELFHVYIASSGISSTNDLTVSDMEEIGAETIGFHLEQMVSKKRAIYNALKSKGKDE